METKWRESTVLDIAAPTRNSLVGGPFGSNLVSRDYTDDGVPVIRGQNMGERWVSGDFVFVSHAKAESLRANLASPGDIVFTQRGTLGQVCLVPKIPFERYLVSQSQMKLSVNPRIADPLFFYYVFRSAEQQDYIRQHAIQTGVPHTNLGILGQTPIPLPPINEQRAIAHILGTLDDRIELNRRMNETLEAMARALFKSWFIDFDPARRNMASRKGQNQPSPGFQPPSPSGRGKGGEGVVEGHAFDHLFPDSLVDSELGDIPEGWDIGSLADLSALNPEVWTSETRPTKLNYVDLSNTKSGQIAAVATYEAVDAPSRAQRVLRPRDTIVGTVRPGNRSYAFISEQGLTGSTGFAVLRPQRTDWAEFVYLTATAADNIDALAHLADGAAYPAVRPEMVAATPIVRPNEGVLARFSLSVGPFFAKIARNQAASRTLAVLRDTLLPKLISGELRIKNIERFVEVST